MAPATKMVTLADGLLVTLVGDDAILVRTRSGVKIHRGHKGAAVTNCGVWLRTNGSRFEVAPEKVQRGNLCESCFYLAGLTGDGAVAADNATTSEEDSMAGKKAPEKARSAAAATADKLEGETISKALTEAVKSRVRGLKVARSKDGFSRYLRVTVEGRERTLARVTNRATLASVKIGTAAPFKLDTVAPAKIEQIAERIAKRADTV